MHRKPIQGSDLWVSSHGIPSFAHIIHGTEFAKIFKRIIPVSPKRTCSTPRHVLWQLLSCAEHCIASPVTRFPHVQLPSVQLGPCLLSRHCHFEMLAPTSVGCPLSAAAVLEMDSNQKIKAAGHPRGTLVASTLRETVVLTRCSPAASVVHSPGFQTLGVERP